MEQDEDLYALLGVLPDAQPIVIAAAERALAARYASGRSAVSAEAARTRLGELEQAAQVLLDPAQRAEYDARSEPWQVAVLDTSEEQNQAFSEALAQLQGRWKIALSIFPKLDELHKRLLKMSAGLSFAFVTTLLKTRNFKEAEAFAQSLEASFLRRYFGTHEDIVAFARELIDLDLEDASRGLNRLVEVLGSEVDPLPLIQSVVRDFGTPWSYVESQLSDASAPLHRQRRDRISKLRSTLGPDHHWYADARELASLLGFNVNEISPSGIKRYFAAPEIEVSEIGSSTVVARFEKPREFTAWAHATLREA